MSSDDRDGFAISLSAHVLVLLLLALVAASPAESLDDETLQLVEVDFGALPTRAVVQGPPQSAPEAAPSSARQPEPERPTSPAATPVEPPTRRTPTPPRPNPLPQPPRDRAAQPSRPNPPSRETRPEPAPTPPQRQTVAEGTGSSDGAASSDGRGDSPSPGSGGNAPAEVGFQFGNRDFDCPRVPFAGTVGTIQFQVTFAPNGRYVTSRPRSRNAELERLVRGVIAGCRAQPLPPNAAQVNQTTTAIFNFVAN